MTFDLERVKSRWAGKHRLNASPTVILFAFVGKYLKCRFCHNLPLAPTSPGLPCLLGADDDWLLGAYQMETQNSRKARPDPTSAPASHKIRWAWDPQAW